MSFKSHFQLMAKYNQRLNNQVYEQARQLTDEELKRDSGAFFGSVLGSLNHILVGDLIWLARFRVHSDGYQSLAQIESYPRPTALNELLFHNIAELHQARVELDKLIVEWIDETSDSDFDSCLAYQNTKGLEFNKNFGELVAHFFNHQTHHRGQVSTLLSQHGKDIGVTDFLVDIPGRSSST